MRSPHVPLAARLGAVAFALAVSATAGTFFVAPNGSDLNPGTFEAPWGTLQHAVDQANPGDTLYLRGGTYYPAANTTIHITRSGTAAAPIRLWAYAGERPVLDAQFWARATPLDRFDYVILQEANWWHVRGLVVTRGPSIGYLCASCQNNVFEQLEILANDNRGFSLYGPGTSNNLILNSDFSFNYDPLDHGQNADGLGINFGSGTGNVVRGCRAFANSDDGFDFWAFESAITIEQSWAFENGIDHWADPAFEGNGNGFKLGGGSGSVPAVVHRVQQNVAWGNVARGFDENGNAGPLEVYQNTAFANGGAAFQFQLGPHRLRNNLALDNGGLLVGPADDSFNSWNLFASDELSSADLLGVDPALARGPRAPDGSLPWTTFLRPAPGSPLIDAGIDIGLPFADLAPDLGAFEQPSTVFRDGFETGNTSAWSTVRGAP